MLAMTGLWQTTIRQLALPGCMRSRESHINLPRLSYHFRLAHL